MGTGTAAALSDDLLAGIFGRLPARSLVASCGVCKAWRRLIDERQLLRRQLPHSVRGLFINYQDHERPHFLSRPTPTTSSPGAANGGPGRIDGKFDFIPRERRYSWYEVVDHCNGLVLFLESDDEVLHVCNPTTRWSARLPPCPAGAPCYYSARAWGRRAFLVFDPLVSLEYKVLLSPVEPRKEQMEKDDACRLMEWPPSAWTMWHEFSSSTGRWAEKVFVREGEAAGTAGDLLLYENDWGFRVEPPCRYAAYWKGALYVHWRGEFVSRLSLLDDKYKVVKTPIQLTEGKDHGVQSFLGRSEKGVYIAAIATEALATLRVWTLSESGGHMEWVPKDQSNLEINTCSWSLENNEFDELKCWVLDLKPQYWKFDLDDGRKNQDISLVEQNVGWNSDDDNIVDVSDDEDDEEEALPFVKFLGFHPYKEVIFLCSDGYAVAFHLNSPKVQYLGTVHLGGEYHRGIRESFVYTPCLIGHY